MQYAPHRKIDMRREAHVTEKWVQARIEEDPTLLGLGEVDLKDSERRQTAGGRLDLLLHDPETQTRYEVELMLGQTDESHIIRTIEYWDNERRRYPQYEHVAVIVAEEITARFFNVISLLNGQIPIIAIQVSLIEVGEVRTLVFTRVLDHVTLAVEEDDEPSDPTDRAYWVDKASPDTVALADELFRLAKEVSPEVQPNYNRHYIGMHVDGVATNFFNVKPRQKGFAIVELRIPPDEERREELEELGFEVMSYDARFKNFRLRLRLEDLQQRRDALLALMADAAAFYEGRSMPSTQEVREPGPGVVT